MLMVRRANMGAFHSSQKGEAQSPGGRPVKPDAAGPGFQQL
jgi:hypothetical protein